MYLRRSTVVLESIKVSECNTILRRTSCRSFPGTSSGGFIVIYWIVVFSLLNKCRRSACTFTVGDRQVSQGVFSPFAVPPDPKPRQHLWLTIDSFRLAAPVLRGHVFSQLQNQYLDHVPRLFILQHTLYPDPSHHHYPLHTPTFTLSVRFVFALVSLQSQGVQHLFICAPLIFFSKDETLNCMWCNVKTLQFSALILLP